MTKEEAIMYLKRADITVGREPKTKTAEALEMAIDTIRKYQKIQEIVKEWREVGLDYDSCDAMMNIERVIEE